MEMPKDSGWNLQKRISNLLQKEFTSDAEFLVGEPPQRFKCHSIILAAGSPVFETMFFGTIRQKSPVRVPDVTTKGFATLLQYLYADKVSIQDESEAFEIAYASKKYMIKSLFDICEVFILENLKLNPENVFATHEESTFLEMAKLQSHCLRFVSRNAQKIFHAKSFTKASKDTFQDILRLDLMNIENETEVIEALWLWGKEQCKENGVECSVENVRSFTKELLQYVRFFALKMDEVVSVLGKCQILDTSEEMALLWNIAMPRTTGPITMPSNICTESKSRSILNSKKIELPGKYRYDGNMTSFLIENQHKKIGITVTGSPVTIIGVVVAFKAIPCYSSSDRSLDVEFSVINSSSNFQSSAKCRYKADSPVAKVEEQQLLLLDNYVLIEEQQTATLTVTVTAEGVRIMQCTEEEFNCDVGKSEMCLKFEQSEGGQSNLFPIKELMVV